MHAFWRHPALPVGVVLLVLGLGNWLVSRDKVAEYSRRAAASAPSAPVESLEGFARLTPRTNATVLDRLHRRARGEYGIEDAKRDFYSVVESGGRLTIVAGLLSIGLGLIGGWRDRRLGRGAGRRDPNGGGAAPRLSTGRA